jgi:hypothetical protein
MRRSLIIPYTIMTCVMASISFSRSVIASDVSPPLTHDECVKLVKRELELPVFSETSPIAAESIANCSAGKNFNNRASYDCMFSATYVDPLDCMYKARGMDRSKLTPDLAYRTVVGDDGGYEDYVSSITKAVYQGQDPHTTIDPQLRRRYLTHRNNVLLSLGETPPSDDKAPSHTSASRAVIAGHTYWIVRENYTDLQLLKIMREENGTETVFCARFGSPMTLRTDEGLCAFLINKHWNVIIPD